MFQSVQGGAAEVEKNFSTFEAACVPAEPVCNTFSIGNDAARAQAAMHLQVPAAAQLKRICQFAV
ncbi:MAG: hypothetical protein RR855_07345 [Comamonas sp.]